MISYVRRSSYKQNKFNLLREQSEGYTKLTTDLIASLGPPNIAATATPVESLDAVRTRAAAVWERVVSLIGYFDLDPNRALDIILDVFSVNIATHWQFFLSLLACSPWVGGHTCLQDWNNAASMKDDTQEHPYRGKSLDEVLLHAESSVRGSRPPSKFNADCKPKPKVLAQVLGFKFNHYQVGPLSYHSLWNGGISTSIFLLRFSHQKRKPHVQGAYT